MIQTIALIKLRTVSNADREYGENETTRVFKLEVVDSVDEGESLTDSEEVPSFVLSEYDRGYRPLETVTFKAVFDTIAAGEDVEESILSFFEERTTDYIMDREVAKTWIVNRQHSVDIKSWLDRVALLRDEKC
jgi:hypothetical protein